MNAFQYLLCVLPIVLALVPTVTPIDCSTLRLGQYICPDPDLKIPLIDKDTQQLVNCTKENKAEGSNLTFPNLFTFCILKFDRMIFFTSLVYRHSWNNM